MIQVIIPTFYKVVGMIAPTKNVCQSRKWHIAGCFLAMSDYNQYIQTKHTMKEFRIVASRVSNYIAYVEANDESEAEALALKSDTDWQFLDDDADYQVYTVEEAE